jgi:Lon protease-like protein
MQRDLPARPNLDHLKKQAKDLLDAHQRGDEQALARIRTAVPSFATLSDEDLARAPFALHDAQSAVAREYGLKSWNELRDEVARRTADPPLSEELLRALMNRPFPEAVGAAMRDASARRSEAVAAAKTPIPRGLPLVAMRNALLVPRAFSPIHVGRPASKAAVEAALARKPATLAIFAQRAEETEDVDAASLHPVGCEAIVYAQIPDGDRAWVILEGVRWLSLDSIEWAPAGHPMARVKALHVERGDDAEVSALADGLRVRARPLASALPGGSQIVAMIDALDAEPLADLVVANLPVPVAEKARYASAPKLTERLLIATAWTEALAAASNAPR